MPSRHRKPPKPVFYPVPMRVVRSVVQTRKPRRIRPVDPRRRIQSITRPTNGLLTSLADKVTKVRVPEDGSFNAGLAIAEPGADGYILAYRPDEYAFVLCRLDEQFQPIQKSFFRLSVTNCADPRLQWLPDGRLLIVYSSNADGIPLECIRGIVVMDLSKSNNFIDGKPFKISLDDGQRQKNWMPFVCDDKLYVVASTCPHIVYEAVPHKNGFVCGERFKTSWVSPWISNEFMRGNANIVPLRDGSYMGTFHTVQVISGCHFYDNGAYVFEGKPPFNVIKCASRTYLKAEDAVEKHFRKAGQIVCPFPVGMVREDERLFISYGDNDSAVKVMETTVTDMMDLMVEVY